MFAKIVKGLVDVGFVLCILGCVIIGIMATGATKSSEEAAIVGAFFGSVLGIILFAFIGAMAEMACDIRDIKVMMRKYIKNQSIDYSEKEENNAAKVLLYNDADKKTGRYCTACGSLIKHDSVFCTNCGASIKGAVNANNYDIEYNAEDTVEQDNEIRGLSNEYNYNSDSNIPDNKTDKKGFYIPR